jgi:hypothetical protein
MLLTSKTVAHLSAKVHSDVIAFVTSVDYDQVQYFYRLLVRANTKRDSYTAHPIAEEIILRERRRETPSRKPCAPRSLGTSCLRSKTRSKEKC